MYCGDKERHGLMKDSLSNNTMGGESGGESGSATSSMSMRDNLRNSGLGMFHKMLSSASLGVRGGNESIFGDLFSLFSVQQSSSSAYFDKDRKGSRARSFLFGVDC